MTNSPFSQSSFIQSDPYHQAYLGKAIDELYKTVMGQMAVVYKARGLLFPVSSSSTLHYLRNNDGASLAEIARALNATHQLSTQKIKILQKLGLVSKHPDPNDLRRYEWRLTEKGRAQTEILDKCMQDVTLIFDQYYEQLGFNLRDVVSKAQEALLACPMERRFQEATFPERRE